MDKLFEIIPRFFSDVNLIAKTVCNAKIQTTYHEMFDKQNLTSREKYFLKQQRLSDVVFMHDVPGKTFFIKNQLTGETIKCSDRPGTLGELRSENLRELLFYYQDNYPELTLSQTIEKIVYSRQSSLVRYSVPALSEYYPELNEVIIANYIEILLELRKKGITFDNIEENTPLAKKQRAQLLKILQQVIYLDSPEFKAAFYKKIKRLIASTVAFDNMGDHESYETTQKLRKKLTEAGSVFFEPIDFSHYAPDQGIMHFKKQCEEALHESYEFFHNKGLKKIVNYIQQTISYLLNLFPFELTKKPYRFFKIKDSTSDIIENLEQQISKLTPGI